MSEPESAIEGISAVTVYTAAMSRAVSFYQALGFTCVYGGEDAAFTSFKAGSGYVNLIAGTLPQGHWGRVILYVADVDAMYQRATAAGYPTLTSPRDAEWGERYFHIADPDGNELSFACPLSRPQT